MTPNPGSDEIPLRRSRRNAIDVIVLTRDGLPPPNRVRDGLECQSGVRLAIHLVDGTARPGETNRLETITRARNAGSRLGSAPWLMFLDDDVVLGPDCIALLLDELRRRPGYAALAADYLGELADFDRFGTFYETGVLPTTSHVGMGATLFRREALAYLSFHWQPGRCECQCCCDDLRRMGLGIAYLPGARATHERGQDARGHHSSLQPATVQDRRSGTPAGRPSTPGPRILTTFDRGHLNRFLLQFLPTLRESGNDENGHGGGLRPLAQRKAKARRGPRG